MYAERKGWDLSTVIVDTRYDVDDGGTATIERTVTLPSTMPADQRDRLAEIADKTPVTRAVRAGTPIVTTMRSDASS
jgi:putative redox protein